MKPGRSSYCVFVEAQPEAHAIPATEQPPQPQLEPGGSADHHQHRDHQARLFVAALRGILALPPPLGPGRLAFGGVPAYAAAAMLEALREAGYDNTWDEPCFRYSLTTSSMPPSLRELLAKDETCARAADGKAPTDGPPYVLDSLRTEADAQLVDRHWAYRSPYSMPLVRLIVAHGRTVCVRLPRTGRPSAGSLLQSHEIPTSSNRAPTATPGGLVPAAPGSGPSPHGPAPSTQPPANSAASSAASLAMLATAEGPGPVPDWTRGAKAVSGSGSESESESGSSDAVAWILQYPDGVLGLAHTLEDHRRRGLMRRCVLEVVRQELLGPQRGAPVEQELCTFMVAGNTASARLFESLGFRRSPVAYHWLGVEGHEDPWVQQQGEDQEQRSSGAVPSGSQPEGSDGG